MIITHPSALSPTYLSINLSAHLIIIRLFPTLFHPCQSTPPSFPTLLPHPSLHPPLPSAPHPSTSSALTNHLLIHLFGSKWLQEHSTIHVCGNNMQTRHILFIFVILNLNTWTVSESKTGVLVMATDISSVQCNNGISEFFGQNKLFILFCSALRSATRLHRVHIDTINSESTEASKFWHN